MFSNLAMKLNVFRRVMTEDTQDFPENVSSSAADQNFDKLFESVSKPNKTKLGGTQQHQSNKSTIEKRVSSNKVEPPKRPNFRQQEFSIYRSKTGSYYATKAARSSSSIKDLKHEKEKSPTPEHGIRKRKFINTVNGATEDVSLKAKDNAKTNLEDDGLGWCQIVYYILTLQFLRDLVIVTFNICKQRFELLVECYILCPVRNTRDRIKSIIDSIRTWCFQQLDIYLIHPIDYIRNSYISPIYRHSCNLIQNLVWCFTNSKKYCVVLFDVICLRIAKLAENFRHYFAVLFLTNCLPENYSMAYHLFALFRLVLGTLYPAYASYKAVRTKNVREYVKWMMYWIVFAAFSLFETFADIFVAFWFPFYYEVKILLLIWLISPVSRGSLGSSIIYRKFVHPALMKREDEIDHMMLRMQEQGYHTLAQFGGRAFTYVSNFVMQTAIKGGGGLVTQLKKSYSLTDLVLTPDNDESSKFDTRSTRRALPQITDITDDYYEEDSRLRERTFSEGSTAKAQQQRETNPVRRRNFSPGGQGRHYEENIDEQDGISGHNTIPRDTRYYHPESETNIRRMSPRKPNQNYDTSPIMEHYPEAIARKSPQRGQIIVYQDQPSMLYTEDSELVDVDRQRRSASLSTSPNHTPQHTNKSVRSKKTSCPSGTFVTHRGKPVRSRPKSLAFDHNVIDMHGENWLNEYTESSTISNVSQPDFQIRKYRSVISLNSDNTSSVKAIPQLTKSKSVHQSPVKHSRTPKMIDVSPQYFAAGSSSQIKSKEQGASRVKQLLFRRMSRSSESKNSEVLQNIPISKRSQSSSSPTTRSNMRFLRKKTNDDEEDYLLPSPHDDDNDDFDSTHDQIYSSHNDPLTLYSSGEESN